MVQKTWHNFVKMAKIMAKSLQKSSVYTAANLLKLMVSNSRKIYIPGKIHTGTTMSRSHILPVTKHSTDFGSRGKGKVSIFVLNSPNKLQIMLIKNKIFL